ncbi:MAG: hypothetical protein PWQ97_1418 [Tepidanaerobacteraceae bacterium]|nr:hypothetical protein [Tepidanaerobacteraceae bacterium]
MVAGGFDSAGGNKEKDTAVSFDIFSIFVICVIGLFSLGIYALSEVGVIGRISRMVSSQDFVLAVEPERFDIDGSVRKIIIESPDCELTVRTGKEHSVISRGSARVTADSRKTAENLLSSRKVVFYKSGDTLYISFNTPSSGDGHGFYARMTGYTVIVPEDIDIEINNGRYLKISADNLKSNWLVENSGKVEIRLPGSADARVKAVVDDRESLEGNAEWKITGNDAKDTNPPHSIVGEAVFGSGSYSINVMGGDIIVNY